MNMEPLVRAIKSTFGCLFNSREGMGGGAGKKPTAGALMAWEGQILSWSESYDLLLETFNILWTPHPSGNSYKTVGKGIKKRKVLMTDKEQNFSDLKQIFNRICKEPSIKPRVYKEGSYDKKQTKRKGDAEAVRNGTILLFSN